MDKLNIFLQNVRGLRDAGKRKQVFHVFKKLNAHIVLLQETHSLKADQMLWKNGWSAAKGVMILFKKRLNITIDKVTRDELGRYICVDLCYCQQENHLNEYLCANK